MLRNHYVGCVERAGRDIPAVAACDQRRQVTSGPSLILFLADCEVTHRHAKEWANFIILD